MCPHRPAPGGQSSDPRGAHTAAASAQLRDAARPSLSAKQHVEPVRSQGSTQWPRAWGAGPHGLATSPSRGLSTLPVSERGERPYRFDDGGLTLLPLLAAWSFDLKFTKRRCRENEVGREEKARCQPSGNSLPRQGRPQQPPQAQGSEASKAAPTGP